MTRISVKKLIWTEANVLHLRKHRVTPDEVSVAVSQFKYHKRTHDKRYLLVGRSGKRIISVVIKRQASSVYYVVTARDAGRKERRRLYEKEK